MKLKARIGILVLALAAGPGDAAEPAAVIDLATRDGVALAAAAWRYSDVSLVPAQHRAPDAAGQPTGPAVATWDFSPRAGLRDYDDSGWPVLEPEALAERRGHGRLGFNWYRIAVTVPPRIGTFDTRGARVEFEASVDDYAEIWVDGELPRAAGQSGGSVIAGWNATNRVTVARNVQPGQRIQLAIFGINGPLSDPPANFIWLRLARLVFYAGAPGDVGPVAVPPQEVNVRVARLQPAIDRIVPANPKIFKLAEGFQFTEGPVWLRERKTLLFSDPNANRIYAYDAAAARLDVFREQSGYAGSDIARYRQPGSNGLALDPAGRLTINQHGNRRVIRVEADGSTTTLAERHKGRRLNSPNDVVYAADGALYFTDPPFGLPDVYADPGKELGFSGVYRAKDGVVTLLTRELKGPNGLAFSPDQRHLYVGNWDPERKVVLRLPVLTDGSLGASEVFADMTAELPGDEALDGVKVDEQGNVYIASPDGVRIYSAAGLHLGTITAPRPVHNLAWGGPDGRTLYLCARDRLYRIDLLVGGLRP